MQALTIPLDTAKVRLQLQGGKAEGGGQLKYRGLIGTIGTVAREEVSARSLSSAMLPHQQLSRSRSVGCRGTLAGH